MASYGLLGTGSVPHTALTGVPSGHAQTMSKAKTISSGSHLFA